MNRPKVSVIIPVYNVEGSLERCVNSICSQTLSDIEIILVDDGSPDGCPAICDKLAETDSRIKVIHKKNGGLGYARNSGMEIAEGEFVAFVDSDDYVDINMYKVLYEAAVKNGADAAYCGFYYVKDDKITGSCSCDSKKIFDSPQKIKCFLMDLIAADISYPDDTKYKPTVWKAVFSRKLIEKHSVRFYSEKELVSEDSLFDMDLIPKMSKIVMLPDCFYYYMYNPMSLTTSYRKDRFEKNKRLFFFGRKKLFNIYHDEAMLVQYSRMFISEMRVAVIQEANNASKNGFMTAMRNINAICSDKAVQKVLKAFPWQSLPLKRRVFAFLIRYRLVFSQYVVVRLMYYSKELLNVGKDK